MDNYKYKFKIYNNIISFGCMCSTALHLRKIGVRSSSTFFDWIGGDLESYMNLVNNNFDDVFNCKYFLQDFPETLNVVKNTKCNIYFGHVFNVKETLKHQYKKANKYVQKAISNFWHALNDKCLLVYYSRFEDETKWIANNQEKIAEFCNKYSCDIIFVLNYDIQCKFMFKKFIIPQNNIHKPFGGGVSYLFENTELLDEFLLSHYDGLKRKKNLKFKKRRNLFSIIKHKIQYYKKDKFFVNENF